VECIVEVPNGAHVEEDPDPHSADLIISHAQLGTWRHTAHPICSDPMHAPAPQQHQPPPRRPRQQPRQPRQSSLPLQPNGSNDCNDMPCTCDSLPCNNWIDTAGWMLDPFDEGPYIGGFSTVMSVPTTPAKPDQGQTLFYFPGAENTDGTPRHGAPPPSGRAILQPVLTYGPESNCVGSSPASKSGWCIASWYCCPKNLTVHSTYLGDVSPGDSWLGLFNLTDDTTFETVSRNVATGMETKLTCPRQGRNFNWADATLEVYNVKVVRRVCGGADDLLGTEHVGRARQADGAGVAGDGTEGLRRVHCGKPRVEHDHDHPRWWPARRRRVL